MRNAAAVPAESMNWDRQKQSMRTFLRPCARDASEFGDGSGAVSMSLGRVVGKPVTTDTGMGTGAGVSTSPASPSSLFLSSSRTSALSNVGMATGIGFKSASVLMVMSSQEVAVTTSDSTIATRQLRPVTQFTPRDSISGKHLAKPSQPSFLCSTPTPPVPSALRCSHLAPISSSGHRRSFPALFCSAPGPAVHPRASRMSNVVSSAHASMSRAHAVLTITRRARVV